MSPYFIINPIAGGGGALQKFAEVREILKIGDERCKFTQHEREAKSLAQSAYEAGERYIVAVGGDGTVNEVASALFDKPDAVMGILPFGTGNDFAKAVNIPSEPREAAGVISKGEAKRIDMGLANGVPFINVAGVGFDVDVLINTEKFKKRFHKGMLPYFLGIIKTLLHIKKLPATIISDGQEQQKDILLCAVGNGTHYGGGMAVTPKARFDDGLFDVCVIKNACLPRLLVILPGFIKGRHLKSKLVDYYRASVVKVQCERQPLQLDGEVGAEYSPVEYRILPGALRLMLPAEEGAQAQ